MLASAKLRAASQLCNKCIFLRGASLADQRVHGACFIFLLFIIELLSIEGVAGEVLLTRLALVKTSVACRQASISTRLT